MCIYHLPLFLRYVSELLTITGLIAITFFWLRLSTGWLKQCKIVLLLFSRIFSGDISMKLTVNKTNQWTTFFTAGLFFILACGGGGGGENNPSQNNSDTTPDPFVFNDQATTQLSTLIESASVTISGIDQATSISVSGGEYQINGTGYTSTPGTVTVNDSVSMRVLSSSSINQMTSAELVVGGISDSFNITTQSIITRVSNTACIAPEQAENGINDIQIEDAFPNLTISSLVGLYQSAGDDSRWYAMSQSGRVYWFDNSPSATVLNDFADLSSLVLNSGERGLLGMAFDPQYATNGRVYFSYVNNNSQSIIARLTNQGSLPLDISNPDILLTLAQPASNHNGGHISFGPDNYLYLGFGDGGGGGDTYNHGQNTQSLHSTIMRIDVSGNDYTVPTDNPFVNNANVLDEIYAYGLRNPWRWSFDSQTGELWVADVGQNNYEEVNLVQAGDNLGWPIMEGNHCFENNNCNMTGLTLPVTEYDHSSGDCSITGGFVYRGQNIPSLQGHFIYGDYCSGTVRSASRQADQSYLAQELLLSGQNISSFAQGADGEVLLLSISGKIYRLFEAQPSSSSIPDSLSATGCFASTENKTYPDFVVPFDVESELWSDGEQKSRLFAIPDNSNIESLADGDFIFPDQSILIKNFIQNDTYLETRLFMKHLTGWSGYSYRWLNDQTDAVLVEGALPEDININNISHTIPSRGQCFTCHTSTVNVSLGPEASQLNFSISYPNNAEGNQLDALAGSGFLSVKPNASQITDMARIDDESESIEIRARSYLHSNCSGCHRPGGPASQIDFRIQTQLADTMACDQLPASGDMGIIDARIIAPGDVARSVLIARMQSVESDSRMPPLATQLLDSQALNVIGQWITDLSDCQ